MGANPYGLIIPSMTRRRLLEILGLSAAAALAARARPELSTVFAASPQSFPVTHVNHLSLVVGDYATSRDFYMDLFDMRLAWDDGKMCALEFGSVAAPNGMYIRGRNPGEKLGVNHIAFAMADFMTHKASLKAELERRGLKNLRGDGAVGWSFDDPAGYPLNVVVVKDKAMFPGAASPCADSESAACANAHAAGLKNLDARPRPAGQRLPASSFSHIVLNVADVPAETAFYRDVLGMQVIAAAKSASGCALRFGRNTLYLRQLLTPGDKPFVDHFAFVIDRWDRAKVRAALERRGLTPTANSDSAWTIADPDGVMIEAAAWELPPAAAR
jgi:catechol 2,3-dioxygenase-like lactoylglutathione lyase family enzyme